jgi:hypothetical protein
MAVVFNEDYEKLETTEAPDYNAAYTVCFWIRPEQIDSAFHHIFTAQANDTTNNIDDLYISSGNQLVQRAYRVGAGGTTGVGTTIVQDTWYHVAIVRESAAFLQVYLNGALDTTSATQDVTERTPATKLCFGLSTWAPANELNGRMAHIKVWTAALTVDEVLNEMNAIRPLRMADLWGFWPLLVGARTLDLSGNGRTLIETGAITDADDPGIVWGAAPVYINRTPAIAGTDRLTAYGVTTGAPIVPLLSLFLGTQVPPVTRTAIVPAETRAAVVSGESRLAAIAFENRTTGV